MTAKQTPPTTHDVREWAEANKVIKPGQRGRFGTDVVAAYNKAHPRNKYVITYSKRAEPTIKVTGRKPNRKGGTTPVTRTLPVSVVRSVAQSGGVAGARGPLTDAAKAYAAVHAPSA